MLIKLLFQLVCWVFILFLTKLFRTKHAVSGAFQDRFWHSAAEGTPRNAPKSYCQNFKHFSKFNKILLLTLHFVLPCLPKHFFIKVFMFKLPMLFSLLVFFTTWSLFAIIFLKNLRKTPVLWLGNTFLKGSGSNVKSYLKRHCCRFLDICFLKYFLDSSSIITGQIVLNENIAGIWFVSRNQPVMQSNILQITKHDWSENVTFSCLKETNLTLGIAVSCKKIPPNVIFKRQ